MSSTFYTNVSVASNKILYRGYKDGKRVSHKEPFSPSLYVPGKPDSKWKDIHGNPLEEIKFEGIKEAKEFIEQYEGTSNFTIHGNDYWQYQYIASLYPNHEDADYDHLVLKIANLDIEVESENGFSSPEAATEKINVITVRCGTEKWVMGTGSFVLPDEPGLHQFADLSEEDLLKKFYAVMESIDPDVITGWNIRFFDIPYIINRTLRVIDGLDPTDPEVKINGTFASRLSPWRQARRQIVEKWQKMSQVYVLGGVAILDYYELYRKYVLEPRESYSLNFIAETELGRKKIDYSQYNSIREFYKADYQRYVEYNVEDTALVEAIDAKRNLLKLHIMMAYIAKVNYEDVFKQVRTWDSIIYNYLLAMNVAVPFPTKHEKNSKYEGAYVKDPQIGMHQWVVSFDLASLYPHLIMQYNISPDTLIENPATRLKFSIQDLLQKKVDTSSLKTHDYSMTANGQMFRKDIHGFLPALMERYYKDRKKYKKMATEFTKQYEVETDVEKKKELSKAISKYDTMQMAFKIALNSAYGACGNQHFRYYDPRLAEGITFSGKLSIQWVGQAVNAYLNKTFKTNNLDYIIASDTDSLYLNLGYLVSKIVPAGTEKGKIVDFVNRFCAEKVAVVIDDTFKELSEYMNAYAQRMEMKREVIADRGVWKAKKMYCLNVHDSEGVRYKEPKLKVMGLEVQRSSTPKICRDALKTCVKYLLTGTEDQLIEYVKKFKQDFMKAPIVDIAFPRSANKLDIYTDGQGGYKKKTPIATKSALVYNNFIKSRNLDRDYSAITNGDKIKYLHLRMPNIINSPVVAFTNSIPPQMNLEKYVDRHTQYEKTFKSPLDKLLNSVGWKSEKVATLESLFS